LTLPLQNSFYWAILGAEIIKLMLMPAKRINQLLKGLSFEKKLLGAGSVLLALSVFLPWYQDVDSFKYGYTFLGVTGPLYLAGFTLLALAIANIALIVSDELGKKIPFFNIRKSSFFMASGIFTFYLLLVINSVYFHNKFGVNITFKESQFGMFLAFISASLITIGGYLSGREKSTVLKEFREKAEESLIKIPDSSDMRKPKENLRTIARQNMPAEEPVVQTQIGIDAIARISQNEPVLAQTRHESQDESNKAYQPFRTDL
jgi:hypothetical protein